MKKLLLLTVVFTILSCKKSEELKSYSTLKDVEDLTTDAEKRDFLEHIYKLDQKVRKDNQEMEVKYGYDSKEVAFTIQVARKTDSLNLDNTIKYLNKYGHPTIKNHGEKAAYAPWIVLHHSASIKSREQNFKHFYKAYLDNDLEAESFSMFLNRLHTLKFGYRYSLPSPYQEKDMIDSLIKKLDLHKEL